MLRPIKQKGKRQPLAQMQGGILDLLALVIRFGKNRFQLVADS